MNAYDVSGRTDGAVRRPEDSYPGHSLTGDDPRRVETCAVVNPRLRICLVGAGIRGVSGGGAIETAYAGLSDLLAAAGHQVTFLDTRGDAAMSGTGERAATRTGAAGLRLVPLPASPVPLWSISPELAVSYRVYAWLRD